MYFKGSVVRILIFNVLNFYINLNFFMVGGWVGEGVRLCWTGGCGCIFRYLLFFFFYDFRYFFSYINLICFRYFYFYLC